MDTARLFAPGDPLRALQHEGHPNVVVKTEGRNKKQIDHIDNGKIARFVRYEEGQTDVVIDYEGGRGTVKTVNVYKVPPPPLGPPPVVVPPSTPSDSAPVPKKGVFMPASDSEEGEGGFFSDDDVGEWLGFDPSAQGPLASAPAASAPVANRAQPFSAFQRCKNSVNANDPAPASTPSPSAPIPNEALASTAGQVGVPGLSSDSSEGSDDDDVRTDSKSLYQRGYTVHNSEDNRFYPTPKSSNKMARRH